MPSSSAPVYGSVEEAIVAGYLGYWETRFAVNSSETDPDPNDPRLAAYAADAQLATLVAETQRMRDAGERLAAPAEPHGFQQVRVVSVDGDAAQVQECFVDDGLVVDRVTSAVLDDQVVTFNTTARLRQVDGVWKVTEIRVIQRGEGVSGCALAN
ncbi:MAG TPA: hypothetical protein VNQ73_16185 [Ilumatobacter sp.]|nr:hypothetical protein [Ilumatobacter sp.]